MSPQTATFEPRSCEAHGTKSSAMLEAMINAAAQKSVDSRIHLRKMSPREAPSSRRAAISRARKPDCATVRLM